MATRLRRQRTDGPRPAYGKAGPGTVSPRTPQDAPRPGYQFPMPRRTAPAAGSRAGPPGTVRAGSSPGASRRCGRPGSRAGGTICPTAATSSRPVAAAVAVPGVGRSPHRARSRKQAHSTCPSARRRQAMGPSAPRSVSAAAGSSTIRRIPVRRATPTKRSPPPRSPGPVTRNARCDPSGECVERPSPEPAYDVPPHGSAVSGYAGHGCSAFHPVGNWLACFVPSRRGRSRTFGPTWRTV